ncbi:MAG: glycosyltransferase [Acidobacteria bacterium]|nr:glycosyltransferase [Acidobacteriota bacterium]NIM61149.1 glycosyltransferase [Acidobacteriota bacterium]NIO58024.1 glycosyltransferase [Acidobacteriota bacterium]NIQ29031.1 glycosyltransferase [Acidobacteriota bacterium]NIQ83557.1 glycosyltransferase [Acidobacteriota bacterium]
MSAPLVSTVVLTRDRPESLRRCLDSLRANAYRPFEIVVVDNGSEAGRRKARNWLADWGPEPPLKHIECPPDGFAALRQRGYENAEGEFVVSLDDDCEAAEDLIKRVVERFEAEPDIGMIGGRLENVGFAGAERFKGRGRLGVNGRYEPVEDPADAEVFGSANQSVRRRAFDQAGGYDPYFSDGMEEADLALSLRAAGWRLVYDPAVRVKHVHQPQRFRNRWRNLHRMRLYLFLKHRPPRGAGWFRFAADEAGLLWRELRALWPGRPRGRQGGLVKRMLRPWAWLAVELWKLLATRVAIPWIAFGARRAALRGRR